MQILTTAAKLDWSGWFSGVAGAFISGGASAIAASAAVSVSDPSHDIVGWALLKVAAITFVISGAVSLAKFLQTHPVPEPTSAP